MIGVVSAADEDGARGRDRAIQASAARLAAHPRSMNQPPPSVRLQRLLAADEPEIEGLVALAFAISPDAKRSHSAFATGRTLACGTREIAPRIVAQQASFTIHADEFELAELKFPQPPLQRFIIRKESKRGSRRLLRSLGIHKANLSFQIRIIWRVAENSRLSNLSAYSEFQIKACLGCQRKATAWRSEPGIGPSGRMHGGASALLRPALRLNVTDPGA
jgi:hypothetical protein